jgi:hypothetical protein
MPTPEKPGANPAPFAMFWENSSIEHQSGTDTSGGMDSHSTFKGLVTPTTVTPTIEETSSLKDTIKKFHGHHYESPLESSLSITLIGPSHGPSVTPSSSPPMEALHLEEAGWALVTKPTEYNRAKEGYRKFK